MSLMIKNYLVGSSENSSATVAVSGIVTNQVISKQPILLTNQGALALRVSLEVSSVTVVGAITARIQQATPNGTYANLGSANSSVSITGNGSFIINLNCYRTADAADMPLSQSIRVVLSTTNAGDRITIDKLYVQQGLSN